MAKPLKIFIDCGAHKGLVAKHFLENNPGYRAYLFEPNKALDVAYFKDRVLLHKAVWIRNTTLNLYLDRNGRLEGSSVFADKKGGGVLSTPVPAIDFSQFLDLLAFDKCVVKMDIEGAEYAVLDHLIDTGSILKISDLYIEWHWKKVRMGMKHKARQLMHKSLVRRLRNIPSLKVHGEYLKEHGVKTI